MIIDSFEVKYVRSYSLSDLEKEVNASIEQGWDLSGPLISAPQGYDYIQRMSRGVSLKEPL